MGRVQGTGIGEPVMSGVRIAKPGVPASRVFPGMGVFGVRLWYDGGAERVSSLQGWADLPKTEPDLLEMNG
jgi:hypothetical protein